mmetsp:Transcript_7656/g.21398  ORF Transcript_7656/g.21398 Transcript_7656/m.21398 type:complete len:417 (+) Transcript_7656:162-1412(+)
MPLHAVQKVFITFAAGLATAFAAATLATKEVVACCIGTFGTNALATSTFVARALPVGTHFCTRAATSHALAAFAMLPLASARAALAAEALARAAVEVIVALSVRGLARLPRGHLLGLRVDSGPGGHAGGFERIRVDFADEALELEPVVNLRPILVATQGVRGANERQRLDGPRDGDVEPPGVVREADPASLRSDGGQHDVRRFCALTCVHRHELDVGAQTHDVGTGLLQQLQLWLVERDDLHPLLRPAQHGVFVQQLADFSHFRDVNVRGADFGLRMAAIEPAQALASIREHRLQPSLRSPDKFAGDVQLFSLAIDEATSLGVLPLHHCGVPLAVFPTYLDWRSSLEPVAAAALAAALAAANLLPLLLCVLRQLLECGDDLALVEQVGDERTQAIEHAVLRLQHPRLVATIKHPLH